MPEVLVLQHLTCEPLGTIEEALRRASHTARFIRIQDGQPVPQGMGNSAALIIMGGPMGVYEQDRYPFLTDEIELIQHALKREIPILGVCLGAQLLASALGTEVRPGAHQEIGWHPVTLTPEAAEDALWHGMPSTFEGFHWHGDFLEKPDGAVILASSALTPHQAFRFGAAAYGLQFHLEVTEAVVRDWTTTFADKLAESGTKPDAILSGISEHLTPMQKIAHTVFDRWTALLERAQPS